MAVIINGRDLTIEQVISVCRHHEKVELAPEAVEAVKKARAYVEKKVAEKAVVYGLTTGFGKFANVAIDTEQTAVLQRNLIISHTCSMGKPYEQKYVRAAMLLRANSLARGKFRHSVGNPADLARYAECGHPSDCTGEGLSRRLRRSGAAFMHCVGTDRLRQGRV